MTAFPEVHQLRDPGQTEPKEWNERQRFQAMLISHCKRDLFLEAQLPLMLAKKFWDNPSKAQDPPNLRGTWKSELVDILATRFVHTAGMGTFSEAAVGPMRCAAPPAS